MRKYFSAGLYIELIFLFIIFSCKKDKSVLVADFKVNYKKINTGEKVQFTDISKGNPLTWSWIFNGGTPFISSEQNPMVTYSTPGIYAVSLTVTDEITNNAVVKSEYIEVVEFSCGNNIVDNRDFNLYGTVPINNRCWLKRNLNVGNFVQSNLILADNNVIEKRCFNNDPSLCDIFGGLYTWDELMKYNAPALSGICPTGFIVPTQQIYSELITFAGGADIAGGVLKQEGTALWHVPNTGATDSLAYEAIPSGYLSQNVFMDLYKTTYLWTSDTVSALEAFALLLQYDTSSAKVLKINKNTASPLRCVKNL